MLDVSQGINRAKAPKAVLRRVAWLRRRSIRWWR
jgi:hypothetical protein